MARKEKKYHYIYKTTCLVTNRYYIGMHSTDNLDDGYMGSGRKLKYSIKKYGKDNHVVKIIEFCSTREELSKRESEIVTIVEVKKDDCLNLCVGGGVNATYGFYMSDEHKRKISLANSGSKNGMYGKNFSMSDDHKGKISKSLKNSKKLKESRNSLEYKKKISDFNSKPIYVLDKNLNIVEEFKNMTKSTEFFGCKEANVFNARRDKRMIKRKYWVIYKDDYDEFKKEML